MNIKKSIAFAICGSCFIFNEAIGMVWVNEEPVSKSIVKSSEIYTGLKQCGKQAAPSEFISWLEQIFKTPSSLINDFRNYYDVNGNYVPTFGQKLGDVSNELEKKTGISQLHDESGEPQRVRTLSGHSTYRHMLIDGKPEYVHDDYPSGFNLFESEEKLKTAPYYAMSSHIIPSVFRVLSSQIKRNPKIYVAGVDRNNKNYYTRTLRVSIECDEKAIKELKSSGINLLYYNYKSGEYEPSKPGVVNTITFFTTINGVILTMYPRYKTANSGSKVSVEKNSPVISAVPQEALPSAKRLRISHNIATEKATELLNKASLICIEENKNNSADISVSCDYEQTKCFLKNGLKLIEAVEHIRRITPTTPIVIEGINDIDIINLLAGWCKRNNRSKITIKSCCITSDIFHDAQFNNYFDVEECSLLGSDIVLSYNSAVRSETLKLICSEKAKQEATPEQNSQKVQEIFDLALPYTSYDISPTKLIKCVYLIINDERIVNTVIRSLQNGIKALLIFKYCPIDDESILSSEGRPQFRFEDCEFVGRPDLPAISYLPRSINNNPQIKLEYRPGMEKQFFEGLSFLSADIINIIGVPSSNITNLLIARGTTGKAIPEIRKAPINDRTIPFIFTIYKKFKSSTISPAFLVECQLESDRKSNGILVSLHYNTLRYHIFHAPQKSESDQADEEKQLTAIQAHMLSTLEQAKDNGFSIKNIYITDIQHEDNTKTAVNWCKANLDKDKMVDNWFISKSKINSEIIGKISIKGNLTNCKHSKVGLPFSYQGNIKAARIDHDYKQSDLEVYKEAAINISSLRKFNSFILSGFNPSDLQEMTIFCEKNEIVPPYYTLNCFVNETFLKETIHSLKKAKGFNGSKLMSHSIGTFNIDPINKLVFVNISKSPCNDSIVKSGLIYKLNELAKSKEFPYTVLANNGEFAYRL